MLRIDGRKNDEMRKVIITPEYIKHAEGSVLVEFGDTKVIVTATVNNDVPPFLKNTGTGWITAEYSMLPRATTVRNIRDSVKGKISGRSQEIQRLIGRALRSGVDFTKLGERTIIIDADVIQADGGTRTAAITGGFVAMYFAIKKLLLKGDIKENPIKNFIAAVSVGIVQNVEMLDLNFQEDSIAEVDMNVVMNDKDEFIEIQATAEKNAFSYAQLEILLSLAKKGISELINIQKEVLK